jgi:hypothetical protein
MVFPSDHPVVQHYTLPWELEWSGSCACIDWPCVCISPCDIHSIRRIYCQIWTNTDQNWPKLTIYVPIRTHLWNKICVSTYQYAHDVYARIWYVFCIYLACILVRFGT